MYFKKLFQNNVVDQYKVPTGDIVTVKGQVPNRLLEVVSIGDYGTDQNIKADFLGVTRELNGVPNGTIMPLTDKWVVTLSTQYGCSMGCSFCDVPKVGPGINATYDDLVNQLKIGLSLNPDIEHSKRLNIHLARMGEPTFNGNVLDFASCLHRNIYEFWGKSKSVHPVISTMMPESNTKILRFLDIWCNDIKNRLYNGNAGLQMSINSTNDEQRTKMFNGNSMSLEDISDVGKMLPDPVGRKYTLNFALADGYEIDAEKLVNWFDPKKFLVKLTPMHNTNSCVDNDIETTDGYKYFTPYKQVEKDLIDKGFDVIVFVPSEDEEVGKITCGNAVLSTGKPTNCIKGV